MNGKESERRKGKERKGRGKEERKEKLRKVDRNGRKGKCLGMAEKDKKKG